MSLQLAPIASDAPIIATDPKTGRLIASISTFFRQWLLALTQRVQAALVLQGAVLAKADLSAALPTTTIWTTTQAGLYQVNVYSRVTVIDGVASSYQVTIGWLDGGVAQTKVLTLVNGDTTTSLDQATPTVQADSGSNITASATYASTTPNKMHYSVRAGAVLIG